MSKFIKELYKEFSAYTPGEQPKDQEYIKLNTNESPYAPGPRVVNAISAGELEKLRLYPSPDQSQLKEALAKSLNEASSMPDAALAGDVLPGGFLTKENVFVANGSDDILNFAFMAFCDKDRAAVFPDISYGFYEVFADFQGCKKKIIPLREDFSIAPDDYLGLCDDGTPGLIVFANPNAPTGMGLKLDEIEKIVKWNPKSVVLVDEAYVDFGGETAIPLVAKYDNLIVCRTYSKSRSLAGARLGFAVGSKELMQDLEVVKYSTNPYSINRMTELTGLAALEESEYYNKNCEKIIETREWTKAELREMGFKVLDSQANFLFAGVGGESAYLPWTDVTGEELYLWLKENGILVRWFNKNRISDYIRISIGTREDMEALIACLKTFDSK